MQSSNLILKQKCAFINVTGFYNHVRFSELYAFTAAITWKSTNLMCRYPRNVMDVNSGNDGTFNSTFTGTDFVSLCTCVRLKELFLFPELRHISYNSGDIRHSDWSEPRCVGDTACRREFHRTHRIGIRLLFVQRSKILRKSNFCNVLLRIQLWLWP